MIRILIVDNREPSEIIRKLKAKKHLNVKGEFLETGDYLLPDGYAIERKKGSDILSSIANNRLYDQLYNLLQYEHPVLVIISDNKYKDFYFRHSNFIHKQYAGMQVSLTCYPKVKVVYLYDDDEFIDYIELLYKRITEKGTSTRPKPRARKPQNIDEIKENVLAVIKGVGIKMSQKLLHKYGSIEGVVNATVDDMTTIEKLGDKKAQHIYDILHTSYHKNGSKRKK